MQGGDEWWFDRFRFDGVFFARFFLEQKPSQGSKTEWISHYGFGPTDITFSTRVDGRQIVHQLVNITIIYRVLYIQTVVFLAGWFWTINGIQYPHVTYLDFFQVQMCNKAVPAMLALKV